MKTRIISAVVASALVVGLLTLNSFFDVTVVIALALLAAIAVYEMLYCTGAIKVKTPVFVAMLYTAVMLWAYNSHYVSTQTVTLAFVLFVAIYAVVEHKNFDVPQLTMTIAMPIVLSFAFSCLAALINFDASCGIFYFVLLFNFACVTDIGAYFVGCSIGKNKLAPEISPKKTIEGAVGGVLSCVVGTIVTCLIFQVILDKPIDILLISLVTPIFSVLGMFGDLFASVIKRYFGIKDYGNIMPGHGGVLDRTDSILFIAPAFLLFLTYFSVI